MTTVSDRNIERLIADPPLVFKLLAPDDPEAYEQARKGASATTSLLSRLFAKKVVPTDAVEPLGISETEAQTIDVDKSWHGLHYLFTGTAWEGEPPLNFIAGGGRQVGDLEVGYGPARVFSAHETQAIAAALATLEESTLRQRYQPKDMTSKEIYPEVIWERDGNEALEYVMEYFYSMRDFIESAARNRTGLLVYLS